VVWLDESVGEIEREKREDGRRLRVMLGEKKKGIE
jgi:hypothetical protein